MLRVNQLIGFGAGGGAAALPQFIAAGTGAQNTGSDTLAVPYPADIILANDIILCVAVARNTTGNDAGDTVITNISNFSLDGALLHSGGDSSVALWYKRATGSESGSETVTMSVLPSGTKSLTAIMFLFRGCITTGSPLEAGSSANVNSSATWTQTALTTTLASRLGIHIIGHMGSVTAGSFTGETGGDFTEAAIFSGTNATIQLQIAPMPNPTTISGGSVTASGAAIQGRQSRALIPVPA